MLTIILVIGLEILLYNTMVLGNDMVPLDLLCWICAVMSFSLHFVVTCKLGLLAVYASHKEAWFKQSFDVYFKVKDPNLHRPLTCG